MKIIQLFKDRLSRRHHGQCQRCPRVDYLPWATEHGIRFCGHCFEKDALEYVAIKYGDLPKRAATFISANDPFGDHFSADDLNRLDPTGGYVERYVPPYQGEL